MFSKRNVEVSENVPGGVFYVVGNSYDDCKSQLYNRYQDRYEILSYKTELKGGFLGVGQKEQIRAAYIVREPQAPSPSVSVRQPSPYYGGRAANSSYGEQMADRSGYIRNIGDKSDYIREMPGSGGRQTQEGQGDFLSNRNELLKNLAGGGNLDSMLKFGTLSKQIEEMSKKLDSIENVANSRQEPLSIVKLDELLEENDFTRSYIQGVNAHVKSKLSYEQLDDSELVMNCVADFVADSVKIAPKFGSKKGKKNAHVIVIVGPTGVGKTTTVAKMAAKLMMAAKKQQVDPPKILMVTVDTMRVGAQEQLEHWGDVMGIDVCKAQTREDLKAIYDSHKTVKDFIFIDTSGYSPRDLENIAKLNSLLNVDGMKADVYLAVAADSKASDLECIIRNYEPFDFRSVIVTKFDETLSYGNIVSVLSEKNKSISMIADGQQVLNHLRRAHPLHFLKFLNVNGFNVDKEHIIEKYGPEEGADGEEEK